MKRFSFTCFLFFVLAAALLVQPSLADFKQAVAFYNQGKYNEAIQELKPDLDKNPDWEFGHRLLGLCYLNLKNNALAVSALSRAAQLKSPAYSTYYGLGQAYFNIQKYDDCLSVLSQAEPLASKEKDPDKAKAGLYELRGSAYYRTGKFNEAANDLTNALRLNQSDWGVFFMLGDAYYRLGRIDDAIPALEKVLSLKPGESATTDLLGRAYLKKGASALSGKQYAAALQALLKAKDYNPKEGFIYLNLGEIYLFQKKYSDAEKALNQAADLLPKNGNVYSRLGLAYEYQKKWDLALNSYKKADEISPSKETKEAIARVNENKKK